MKKLRIIQFFTTTGISGYPIYSEIAVYNLDNGDTLTAWVNPDNGDGGCFTLYLYDEAGDIQSVHGNYKTYDEAIKRLIAYGKVLDSNLAVI